MTIFTRLAERLRAIPLAVSVFLLGLGVYIALLPADLRNNADTVDRFFVTRSLIQHLSLQVACGHRLQDSRLVLGRHGCYYAIYAPGQTLLMVPLYLLGELGSRVSGLPTDFLTAIAARSLDPILGACLLAALFLIAEQLGFRRRTSILLTLIIGFASTLLPDQQSGQEHTQVALALAIALYAALRYRNSIRDDDTTRKRSAWRWAGIAGLASGFGLFTRYDFLLEAVLIGIFILWVTQHDNHIDQTLRGKARRGAMALFTFCLGVLPFALFDALWNLVRFGSPSNVGEKAADQFGYPFFEGVASLLASPGKGLIWYLPLIWLLPFTIRRFWQRDRDVYLLLLALFVVDLAFYANVVYWHGDPGWGPRYLYLAAPLLLLPLGEIVENFPRLRLPSRGLVLGVIGLSLAVQLSAVLVDPWRFWYSMVQYRQHHHQLFVWNATRYDYYWSRNPTLMPALYQFDAVDDVTRAALGQRSYAIPLESAPQPKTAGPRPIPFSRRLGPGQRSEIYTPMDPDQQVVFGIAHRPLNKLSPIWLNDHYQWITPNVVPLGIAARTLVLILLGTVAGVGAASLHLQFWSAPNQDPHRRGAANTS